MKRSRLAATLGIALASTLMLSACTGPVGAAAIFDNDDDAATSYEGAAESLADSDQNDSPTGGTGREQFLAGLATDSPYFPVTMPGPLDEFLVRTGFSWAGLNQQETFRRWSETELRRQERIAECMAEQGFTFYPGLWVGFPGIISGVPYHDLSLLTATPNSREWAETYGLGVFIQNGWELAQAAWHEPGTNPNDAVTSALSESDLQAYQEALWGDPTAENHSFGGSGCVGFAAFYYWVIEDGSPFEAISREVDNFHLNVAGDQRITQLNQDWAACMAMAGHGGFTAPDMPLRGAVDASHTDGFWWELSNVHSTHPIRRTVYTYDSAGIRHYAEDRLTPESAAIAARLQEWERAVAVADWECRNELDYDARLRAIELEMQQEFVDRHWAGLEAWAQHEESRRARLIP